MRLLFLSLSLLWLLSACQFKTTRDTNPKSDPGVRTTSSIPFSPGSGAEASPRLVLQETHPTAVSDLTVSGDGSLGASCSGNGSVLVWNPESFAVLAEPAVGLTTAECLDLTSDGRLLAVGGPSLKLFESRTGKLLYETTNLGNDINRIEELAFSPDGEAIAWAKPDGQLVVQNCKDFTTRFHHQTGEQILKVAFSPDGTQLATSGFGEQVRLYDALTGANLKSYPSRGPNRDLVFSADGKLLATACSEGPRVWVVATGESKKLDGPLLGEVSVRFSADGRRLAAGGYEGDLSLWDLSDGRKILTKKGPQWARVRFGLGGLVSLSESGEATVYDLNDGGVLHEARWKSGSKCLYATETALFLGFENGALKRWDGEAESGLPVSTTVATVGYPSPRYSFVALVSENTLRCLDFKSKSIGPAHRVEGQLRPFVVEDGLITAGREGVFALGPQGRQLQKAQLGSVTGDIFGTPTLSHRIIAFSEGSATLLEVPGGRIVATFEGVERLALSEDGRLALGLCADGTFRAWETDQGDRIAQLEKRPQEDVSGLASYTYTISPSGQVFAPIASVGKPISVWKGERIWKRLQLGEHDPLPVSMAISPDDTQLMLLSPRGSRLIELDSGKVTGSLEPESSELKLEKGVFAPDGTRILAWNQATAYLLKLPDLEIVETLQPFHEIVQARFEEDFITLEGWSSRSHWRKGSLLAPKDGYPGRVGNVGGGVAVFDHMGNEILRFYDFGERGWLLQNADGAYHASQPELLKRFRWSSGDESLTRSLFREDPSQLF